MYADLRPGQLYTATDVIDYLTERVGDMIITVNDDRFPISEAEWTAAFERVFPIALIKFLDNLNKADPELATQLRRQFVAEQEADESAISDALGMS